MALTLVWVNGAWANSVNDVTVSKPTWTADWDILFAITMNYNEYFATPPTWRTRLWYGNDGFYFHELRYKIASSEPSTYTWSDPYYNRKRACVSAYRGINKLDPINTYITSMNSSSGNNIIAGNITVSKANCTLVYLCNNFGDIYTFTPGTTPGTFIEDFDWGDTTSYCCNEVAHYLRTSSGATGNIQALASSLWSSYFAGAIAVNPGTDPIKNASSFQWRF